MQQFTEEELKLEEGRSLVDFSLVNRIGGGMIGCDQHSLVQWHSKYYNTMEDKVRRGRFVGKDQSMMATSCLESDLCLLVEGSLDNWFELQEWFRGDIEKNFSRLNLVRNTSRLNLDS